TIVTLNTTEVTGQHNITAAGVDLTAAKGAEQLVIDLTSAGSGTTQKLLGPNGVSLGSVAPPSGGGVSTASAVGGSGGGGEFSFPHATTSVTPDVQADVNATQVTAGGNVTIRATSGQHVEAYATNGGGGVLHVGETDATVILNNNSLASVGAGTQITAGGDF